MTFVVTLNLRSLVIDKVELIYKEYLTSAYSCTWIVSGMNFLNICANTILLLYSKEGCEVLRFACYCLSMYVCLYVCPLAYLITHMFKRNFLYTCYLWTWLSARLETLQYVMCFRFCGWRHVLHSGAYGIRDRAYADKWSLWFSPIAGAKSAFFDCVVLSRTVASMWYSEKAVYIVQATRFSVGCGTASYPLPYFWYGHPNPNSNPNANTNTNLNPNHTNNP